MGSRPKTEIHVVPLYIDTLKHYQFIADIDL